MTQENTAGKTPSEALQIQAHKAMDQAKRRVEAAEQALRGSKNAAERIEAQGYIKNSHAELQAAEEKYGWVLDWQKASVAAQEVVAQAKNHVDAAARDAQATVEAAHTKLAAKAAAVKKHIVQKGESLSLIAKHYTGDVKKWKELYEKNKLVVGDNPDLIQPGMELLLPWEAI